MIIRISIDINEFFSNEVASTSIEYALLAFILGVSLISLFVLIGNTLYDLYSNVQEAVAS
ncbi:MAG: Flp family type IVb pilin [Candidatus Nucleicultricaceae bacterium]|jgi:Flp pilus assembly pilin Flp